MTTTADIPRVVLVGAESTGKTTLAQELAAHYQTAWVPEYGREHWHEKIKQLQPGDPPAFWSREDFVHIAREQQARENRLVQAANRVLICDTNAFATGTWFERYYQSRDTEVDAIGAADHADLYLLTAPEIPFVQDGVRDGEQIRHWMHERFLEQLSAGPVPFELVTGPRDLRLAGAILVIDRLLTSHP